MTGHSWRTGGCWGAWEGPSEKLGRCPQEQGWGPELGAENSGVQRKGMARQSP